MNENIFSQILWKLLVRTSKKKQNLLYGFGQDMFLRNKMDPDFNYKFYLREVNPYFKKFGFEYSMVESAFYSKASGIESLYYIPWGLWQYFICAYLNRDSWRWPYTDKNMFRRLLDMEKVKQNVSVRLPKTLVCMINGVLYDGDENQITMDMALDILMTKHEDLVFKPSVETHQGHGVRKVAPLSKEQYQTLLENGGG